jgi:hypothetical protein
MITTRWIVHCGVCGYLEQPEYPAQWVPEKDHAYRFHHKRDAMGVVAQYSPNTRERLLVEPVRKHQEDIVFD